jgi:hypothetical protein
MAYSIALTTYEKKKRGEGERKERGRGNSNLLLLFRAFSGPFVRYSVTFAGITVAPPAGMEYCIGCIHLYYFLNHFSF